MKKVKSIIENSLIVVLILLLIFVIISKLQLNNDENPYPSFLGLRILTVLTGSMSPNLNPGDIVIIREVSTSSIKVGDVVTYSIGNALITHRVNQIENEDNNILFKTKGDANNTVDTNAIKANQIIGKKIFHIPYAGYVSNFFSKNFILFPLFIILFIAIIIFKETLKVKN